MVSSIHGQKKAFQIKICDSNEDILATFDVMSQLRNVERALYLAQINRQRAEGYHLISFHDEHGVCRGVAGYKFEERLHPGKIMYVFDLVVDQMVRSYGYGSKLMAYLKQQAIDYQCKAIVLDSGVQRPKAHKFYFNQGFEVTSYNFKIETLHSNFYTKNNSNLSSHATDAAV